MGKNRESLLIRFPLPGRRISPIREFISQMFTQHQPEFHFRVMQFNKAVRKRIGNCRSLLFTQFHEFTDLQSTHFLPSGTQFNVGATARSSGRARTARPQRPKPCRKYNQGTCRRSADACKYAHACIKCGKPHFKSKCWTPAGEHH